MVRWPVAILFSTIMIALIGLITLPGYQPNYNDRQYLPADLPANEASPRPNGTSRSRG